MTRPFTSAWLAELTSRLERCAPTDGIHETRIAGLRVVRASRPSDEHLHVVQQPAVCVIAQGAKRVVLGTEAYDYDASRFLVSSVHVPVSAQVTRATDERPYLCAQLDIDVEALTALVFEMELPDAPRDAPDRGLYLSHSSDAMLEALVRLFRLAEARDEPAVLVPLAVKEVLVRLLTSEEGARLVRLCRPQGHAARIAKAIAWMKRHYAQPMRVDDLASHVHMSPSSLHHHFRAITAMTPLQYQKQLRLQEARLLLLGTDDDAGTIGHRVGYESPSQFSREYARLFGTPPSRHRVEPV